MRIWGSRHHENMCMDLPGQGLGPHGASNSSFLAPLGVWGLFYLSLSKPIGPSFVSLLFLLSLLSHIVPYWNLVPDPGTMFQDPGTMFQDPGTLFQSNPIQKIQKNGKWSRNGQISNEIGRKSRHRDCTVEGNLSRGVPDPQKPKKVRFWALGFVGPGSEKRLPESDQ